MVIRADRDMDEDERGQRRRYNNYSPNGPRFYNDRYQQDAEYLLHYLMERLAININMMSTVLNDITDRLRVEEIAGAVIAGLRRYPLLAMAIAVVMITLSFPFMVFIFFTLITALMTFTGFVILEGSLITVASMLLIGVLIGLGCLVGTIAIMFLMGYFGISKAYECLDRWYPRIRNRNAD